MKTFRDIALTLIVALVLPALAGCAVQELETRLDETERQWEAPLQQSEEVIDRQPYQTEDKIEVALVGQVPESKPAANKDTVPAATQTPMTAAITGQEAESIALAHAGLAAADVTGLRSQSDTDEKVPHYDVEFRKDNVEYEYEIHAQTGMILQSEKDVEKRKTADPIKPEEKPTVQPTVKPESAITKLLTKEEAETAALQDAGLARTDVTKLRTEYDFNDGVPTYEVDFRQGRVEYEYTIHAETGAILKAEKEIDD